MASCAGEDSGTLHLGLNFGCTVVVKSSTALSPHRGGGGGGAQALAWVLP